MKMFVFRRAPLSVSRFDTHHQPFAIRAEHRETIEIGMVGDAIEGPLPSSLMM